MTRVGAIVGAAAIAAVLAIAPASPAGGPSISRGRYLVAYGACNDCHTPGWRESDGALPASRWMIGSNVGYRGPWGTVYPVNVRLWFQQISEDQWLFSVRTRGGLPPMHWHDIRFLDRADRIAIYRFIRSLGPAGKSAPADLPAWKKPTTPYINLVPQQPEP